MTAYLLYQLEQGLERDLAAFLPELVLCGTIVLLLLARFFPRAETKNLGWIALVLTGYALVVTYYQYMEMKFDPREGTRITALPLFGGMLVYDNFTIVLRFFLFSFAVLVIFLTLLTHMPTKNDSPDFFCLLLGATLGMSIMASANHLLIILIGVEMASLPSYALAGFLKGKRTSSEASLKYVVYGSGAAGVMLYGMSLLAGKYGTGYLPDLVRFMGQGTLDPITILGTLFVVIGLAFKLAAVPFHFWCPDVFEGSAAEVAAFLSVASKGAALALLARLILGLTGLGSIDPDPAIWRKVAPYLVPTLASLAAITTTFGNLAAYYQTNLKRLLAYSTIAHAGFMMMGLCVLNRDGAAAVVFYLVVYLFMNLGAFAVVAFLRNLTGSEDLADYRGLVYRNPLIVITLGVFLLSLLGLPPLGGFAAKFQIFAVLFDGANYFARIGETNLSYWLYALIVIGGVNSVISLFYYVKVLKVMVLDKPLEVVENQPVAPLTMSFAPNAYLSLLAVVVVVFGIMWNPLSHFSDYGASNFHALQRGTPAPAQARAEGAQP